MLRSVTGGEGMGKGRGPDQGCGASAAGVRTRGVHALQGAVPGPPVRPRGPIESQGTRPPVGPFRGIYGGFGIMGKRISKNVACRGGKDRRAEGMPYVFSTPIMLAMVMATIKDKKGGVPAWEDAEHRRRYRATRGATSAPPGSRPIASSPRRSS